MSEIFYEAKTIINRMNKSVEHLPEDSELRQLTELVDPLMLTEFGGRTSGEEFIEEVLEAYATIPKVLSSFDATKGMKLTSWGWRLMKNSVLKYIYRADRREAVELNTTGWQDEDTDPDGHDTAWQSDTGWYGEPVGESERSMQWRRDYDAVKQILEPREQKILEWMLEGQTQQYMADKLGLSQSRVNRLISAMEGTIRNFSGIEA